MLTDQAKWKEIMQAPVSRLEAQALEDRIYTHVLSTAMAIEALDTLLTKKGILKGNELLDAVSELVKIKSDQLGAAAAPKSVLEV
jgi:hypothetical protein